MTETEFSMWDAPVEEITSAKTAHATALADAAVEPLWPYLSAARTPAEFQHRLALSQDSIQRMIASVVEDEERRDRLARMVGDTLVERFAPVHRAREAFEASKRLEDAVAASLRPVLAAKPSLVELQGKAYTALGLKGLSGDEDKRKVIDWIKSQIGSTTYSQAELNEATDNNAHSAVQAYEELHKTSSRKQAAGPIRWTSDTHFGANYLVGKAANGDIYEAYFNPNFNPTPCSWVNYGPEGDTGPNSGIDRSGFIFKTMQEAAKAAEEHAAGKTATRKTASWVEQARKVLEEHQHTEVDGMILDATTASMLVSIHDALKPENAAKFAAMPLEKAVTMGWSLMGGTRAQKNAAMDRVADRTGPTIDSAEGYEYTPAPEWVANACRKRFEGGGPTGVDPKRAGWYLHGIGNFWDGPSSVKDNGDHSLSYTNPYTGDTDRFNEQGYWSSIDGQFKTWGSAYEAVRKGAPFAGYEDFDACVRANSDKDDPEAYCGKIKHQVEDGKTSHKASRSAVADLIDTEVNETYCVSCGAEDVSPAGDGLVQCDTCGAVYDPATGLINRHSSRRTAGWESDPDFQAGVARIRKSTDPQVLRDMIAQNGRLRGQMGGRGEYFDNIKQLDEFDRVAMERLRELGHVGSTRTAGPHRTSTCANCGGQIETESNWDDEAELWVHTETGEASCDNGFADEAEPSSFLSSRQSSWVHESPQHAYSHGWQVGVREASGEWVDPDQQGSDNYSTSWIEGYREGRNSEDADLLNSAHPERSFYASRHTAGFAWRRDEFDADSDDALEFILNTLGARLRITFEDGDMEWGTFVTGPTGPEWLNERNDYSHPLEIDAIVDMDQVSAPTPAGQGELFGKEPFDLTARLAAIEVTCEDCGATVPRRAAHLRANFGGSAPKAYCRSCAAKRGWVKWNERSVAASRDAVDALLAFEAAFFHYPQAPQQETYRPRAPRPLHPEEQILDPRKDEDDTDRQQEPQRPTDITRRSSYENSSPDYKRGYRDGYFDNAQGRGFRLQNSSEASNSEYASGYYSGYDAHDAPPREAGRRRAVNEDAYGTERYQRLDAPAKPGWTTEWTDGVAPQEMLDQGRAGHQPENPFAETLTTVRQAALHMAGDIDPHSPVEPNAPGSNLEGFEQNDDFNDISSPPRTTRPRVMPSRTPQTTNPPDFGDTQDPMKPTTEQVVAARVTRLAARVRMDNPGMDEREARKIAARTVAAYPEMVSVQR